MTASPLYYPPSKIHFSRFHCPYPFSTYFSLTRHNAQYNAILNARRRYNFGTFIIKTAIHIQPTTKVNVNLALSLKPFCLEFSLKIKISTIVLLHKYASKQVNELNRSRAFFRLKKYTSSLNTAEGFSEFPHFFISTGVLWLRRDFEVCDEKVVVVRVYICWKLFKTCDE